jgi:hypothetical protein
MRVRRSAPAKVWPLLIAVRPADPSRVAAWLLATSAVLQLFSTPQLLGRSTGVALVGVLAAVTGYAAAAPGLLEGRSPGWLAGLVPTAALLVVRAWAIAGHATGSALLLEIGGLAVVVGYLGIAGWVASLGLSARWARRRMPSGSAPYAHLDGCASPPGMPRASTASLPRMP